MRGKHIFPLFVVLFFIGACCHTDDFQEGPGGQVRPPLESPEPVPVVGAGFGVAPFFDVVPRSLEHIPVGTVIGKEAPKGWSNLILFATPTLTEEDLRDAPKMATHYARMLKFTLLGNVGRIAEGGKKTYNLLKVARGFAIDINGKETIVEGKNTLGADLGLFGRRILSENEAILDKDVYQVARTATMLVFDAQAVMLSGKDHVRMVMRHAILVDPHTGHLSTLVWLLKKAPTGYEPAENALQLLPPNMQEERLLHVLKDRFTLGIPAADAFALVRIPQGRAIPFTTDLQRAAIVGAFARDEVFTLEAALRGAVKTVNQ